MILYDALPLAYLDRGTTWTRVEVWGLGCYVLTEGKRGERHDYIRSFDTYHEIGWVMADEDWKSKNWIKEPWSE